MTRTGVFGMGARGEGRGDLGDGLGIYAVEGSRPDAASLEYSSHGTVRLAKEGNVQEKPKRSTTGRGLASGDKARECDDHREHFAGAADEEDFAAAK